MSFAHEKLDVYRCATEHFVLAVRLAAGVPRGFGFLADQYRRAALSIPLNIAEGVGKTSEDDRRRYYAGARGSAMECAAILDAAELLGIADRQAAAAGKALLERIVQMLSRLCLPKGR